MIGLARRVGEQVKLRFAGKKIPDRLVSLFDTDARPIRRGKLAKPNEFSYVLQYAEVVTANTKPGARRPIVPPKLEAGSTPENALLPKTAAELEALGIELVEGSFYAGFHRADTEAALPGVVAHIVGSHDNAGSPHTRRRRANFRVAAEGRISHLKRSYRAGRSRLKGTVGARIGRVVHPRLRPRHGGPARSPCRSTSEGPRGGNEHVGPGRRRCGGRSAAALRFLARRSRHFYGLRGK